MEITRNAPLTVRALREILFQVQDQDARVFLRNLDRDLAHVTAFELVTFPDGSTQLEIQGHDWRLTGATQGAPAAAAPLTSEERREPATAPSPAATKPVLHPVRTEIGHRLFRSFTDSDWMGYGGADKFAMGEAPLIHEADAFDIILDGHGISVFWHAEHDPATPPWARLLVGTGSSAVSERLITALAEELPQVITPTDLAAIGFDITAAAGRD